MRQYVYSCPLCRHWYTVPSLRMQTFCRERGYCNRCAETNLYRYRCHLARIEASILDTDGVPGGRLKELAAARYPERRGLYRELYRKRENQLQAVLGRHVPQPSCEAV
jgi:hypothetical protein